VLFGLICSMLRAVIVFVEILKEPTSALGLLNVIGLHSNDQHVSANLQGNENKNSDTIIIC